MRLRFAPSPTGRLHVGNARTALFNWLLARGQGGTFVLRIEDTDAERSTPESEAGSLEDLAWLGLGWDEGPDVGGPFGPYRQSERLAIYREHAARLVDAGHAYYCFCPQAQLERDRQAALAAGHVPKYVRRCLVVLPGEARARVAAGEPAAVRFRVPENRVIEFADRVRGRVAVRTDQIGDFVLLRADGGPAYNFAVVVDDGLMGITDVIRGEDHVSNTPRQLLLYEAFAHPVPAFAHLSLVLGPDGTPLSKRHGATSVAEFRARGILPEALVNYLALLGWSPGHDEELLPASEMARRFSLDDVGKRAAVFDPEKLAWVNRHYLKEADAGRLARLAAPFFERAGSVQHLGEEGLAFLASLAPMAQGAIDRLDQFPTRVGFLFDFDPAAALERPDVHEAMRGPGARAVVAALVSELEAGAPPLDRDAFRELAARVRQRSGQKGAPLFQPVRVALTGAVHGPELEQVVPAIARGARLPGSAGFRRIAGCLERARACLAALGD